MAKKNKNKKISKNEDTNYECGPNCICGKKINVWMITTIALGLLLILSLFNVINIDINKNANKEKTLEQGITSEGTRFIGNPNAKVTVTEYSDFRCSFCGRFYRETFSLLKEEYIDTGLIKFEYKDLPVVGGDQAALAGQCANEQGKFWEYKSKLFNNQAQINEANLKTWAYELGLNKQQFDDCMATNKYAAQINKEALEGRTAGATGTPSFVINGELVVGAQPYAVFKQKIDAALTK